jgi:hypothetical protein
MSQLDNEFSSQLFVRKHAHGGHAVACGKWICLSLANIRPKSDRAPDEKKLRIVPLTGPVRPMKLGLLLTKDAESSLTVRSFVKHCKELLVQDEF